jgi:hypothetical protein
MDGEHRQTLDLRRERWRKRSEAAYERMFASGELTTFTEREDMACLLAREMAAFLLEEHLADDTQVRPPEEQPACCPRCQKAGERVSERNKKKLPERPLTTRAGDVVLRREQWRCRTCRILFFSARPQAEARHRGVQPAPAREGHAASSQGDVVSGRE